MRAVFNRKGAGSRPGEAAGLEVGSCRGARPDEGAEARGALRQGAEAVFLRHIDLVLRVVAAVFFVCFLIAILWDRTKLEGVTALAGGDLGRGATGFSAMLFWWIIAAAVLVFLTPYFRGVRAARWLVPFFCLPVAALNLAFFSWVARANGFGITARAFFLISMILMIGLCLVFSSKITKIHAQAAAVVVSLLAMLMVSMPIFLPRALFGFGARFKMDDFAAAHRAGLYLAVLIPFLIYFALRKKPRETREFACVFIALASMIVYAAHNFQIMSLVRNPTHLPLHLCVTAMFILPMTLLFRMRNLFYFTYFINVFGAFMALLLPDFSNSAMTVYSMDYLVFMQNHFIAFFMPILCVAFGLFRRPRLRHFLFSMTAFAIYFWIIVFVNAALDKSYFYTNSLFIPEKLGKWAENVYNNYTWTATFGGRGLVLHPFFQICYFLGYVAIGVGVWFLFSYGYSVADRLNYVFGRTAAIREDRAHLKREMAGRGVWLPLDPKGVDMIKIENFYKRYNNAKNFAVEDVSLTINAGEVFGFLGPNGSGKSTIIKSLVGIQPITKGRIEVCGFDIARQSIEAKRRIGFVPDHYALYERLTGREYVNYVADIYRVSQEQRDEVIGRLLEVFEIKYAFDSQIITYSHGMKQKIAIMAALVHKPKVWILDEPLTGLDPNSIFQVKETMKAHAAAGNIVFFSSHIIDVVERLCDRIAIIARGKLLVVESIANLRERGEALEDFYMRHVGAKGGERE